MQFFLTDPQTYTSPTPRADAAVLRTTDIDIYVHAPYRINVATGNNRIRIPGRKLLSEHAAAAAAIGAKGLIVHGGHVDDPTDRVTGFANGDQLPAYLRSGGTVYINSVDVKSGG